MHLEKEFRVGNDGTANVTILLTIAHLVGHTDMETPILNINYIVECMMYM